jgi:hypothetical protein
MDFSQVARSKAGATGSGPLATAGGFAGGATRTGCSTGVPPPDRTTATTMTADAATTIPAIIGPLLFGAAAVRRIVAGRFFEISDFFEGAIVVSAAETRWVRGVRPEVTSSRSAISWAQSG